MAIEYIKQKDETTSIAAAEKIEVYYLNEQKNNPWLIHRATPTQMEAFKTGGGSYTFQRVLGVTAATRRQNGPTNNTIDYDGVIANDAINLTVSQPFITKVFPLIHSDTIQLDGINYSPIVSQQISESLVAAEINAETTILTGDSNILTIDASATTGDFEQLELIKLKIANYFAINATNDDWAGAGSSVKAYEFYTDNNGTILGSQLRVHMHPKKIMAISNVVTDKGAGSDMQFKQMFSGDVPVIGGVEIISNKYIGVNEVYIMPIGMITGTPHADQMLTKINNWYDQGNDVNAIRGWHWFDAKAVRPELVTKIDFTPVE